MKRLLILGAGTAGTMMANKLRKVLSSEEWEINIVDQHKTHYYQPGFLFIPFGIYNKSDVIKPKTNFIPLGVNMIFADIEKIVPEENKVLLIGGKVMNYDYLIIATGTATCPEETPGLKDKLWYKEIFDFYTIEGALALHEHLKYWEGGKLVVSIADLPFKCPVAPLEFVFLADAYFTQKGIRDKVDITYVTPLSGAFTKPVATKMLSELLKEKNIRSKMCHRTSFGSWNVRCIAQHKYIFILLRLQGMFVSEYIVQIIAQTATGYHFRSLIHRHNC